MKSAAEKLYGSDRCQALFQEAYELFPGHNTSQADEAADWILDHLYDGDDEDLRGELYEAIHAGLT